MKTIMILATLIILAACNITTQEQWNDITTEAEALQFADDTIGFPCNDTNMVWQPLPEVLPIDEHGMYGWPGRTMINNTSVTISYIVNTECRVITEYDEQGRPRSGHYAYRLSFDPNNGWIQEQTCNSEHFSGCSESFRNDPFSNPDRVVYELLE